MQSCGSLGLTSALYGEGIDLTYSGNYEVNSAFDYAYDGNGNLVFDPAKNTTITYNYLNLPEKICFEDEGSYIYYHYDAAGNKLAKHIEDNITTEYVAGLIYVDGKLNSIPTEEGRVVPIDNDEETMWHYEYNLKYHLGNTRAVFGGSDIEGSVDLVQATTYYPFGMVQSQTNYNSGGSDYEQNKYLYNGKELQDDDIGGISLDWYDYGARMYDPAIGRFHTQDRFTDYTPFMSPYSYAGNNPTTYIDHNGDFIFVGSALVVYGLIASAAVITTWVVVYNNSRKFTYVSNSGYNLSRIGDRLMDLFPKSKKIPNEREKQEAINKKPKQQIKQQQILIII